MRYSRVVLAAAAWAVASSSPAQQTPSPPPAFAAPNLSETGVRAMAAGCATCHGTQGRPAAGSSVAGLAGRGRDEIAQAMADFRDGKRPATLMHQIAKGYDEAEIAAIAAYFAKQPR